MILESETRNIVKPMIRKELMQVLEIRSYKTLDRLLKKAGFVKQDKIRVFNRREVREIFDLFGIEY